MKICPYDEQEFSSVNAFRTCQKRPLACGLQMFNYSFSYVILLISNSMDSLHLARAEHWRLTRLLHHHLTEIGKNMNVKSSVGQPSPSFPIYPIPASYNFPVLLSADIFRIVAKLLVRMASNNPPRSAARSFSFSLLKNSSADLILFG